MASWLTTTTVFLRVFFFFQLLQFLTQRQSFSAHRAARMTKADLIFPAFSSKFVDFAVHSPFAVSFHSTGSNARVRFDSGVIFLNQSQFFATHSNQ